MITGSVAVVGEPFKEYVAEQIGVRQSLFASGIGSTPKTPQQLQYINGNNSWVKMASSVSIDAEKGGKEKLIAIGFSESEADAYLGTRLAKKFVLFNGTSNFNTPNERSGVLRNANLNINSAVYGASGIEFGLQAMPGIQSFTVGHANRGSIRTGDIIIRANSEQQFNILELLYIRLGYTMIVEWGHSMYFDNKNNFTSMGPTLIDDGTWFSQEGTTHLKFYDKIENKRKEKNGNYDAFFCKVTNFDWTFTSEGYYEIKLSLISLGDVVESFRINTLPNDTIIKKESESGTEQAEVNENAIANYLYCLRKDSLKKQTEENQSIIINKEIEGSDVVSVFPLEEGKGLKIKQKGVDPNKLYYIRLGYFNEWFEKNILDHITNGSSEPFPIFEMVISDQNYMQIFPGLVSTNPRICYIQNVLPKSKEGQSLGTNQDMQEATKYFKNINDNLPYRYIGRIMDIYLNFDFITSTLRETIDTETQKVDFFSFYKKICDGINSCFGGYVNLKIIISDENKVEFVDDSLPVRTGKNGDTIPEEDTSPQINLYGIDFDKKESNFVRGYQFNTQISNDLATTISVGATANNQSTSELSDFFTRLNRGLVDRYQQQRVDGLPEKPEEQKIKCAEEKKQESFGELLWEKIKYEIKRQTKALQDAIAPNIPELTKYQLYLKYLEDMFGTTSGNLPRYFQYKESDILTGQTYLSSFIRWYYASCSDVSNGETTSSIIGFIPIEFQIDIDGMSGMKIYNQIKVDTRFLPRDYPEVIEFVVSGIQHTIQNNQWTTQIQAISKPGKNLTPVNTGEATQGVQEGTPDEFFELTTDPQILFYPPTNETINNEAIRVDAGGSGFFGASRDGGTRPHDGIDLSTTVGQPIFSPITGIVKRTVVKSGLPAVEISGTGEFSRYSVRILYVELDTKRVPANGRVEKGTFYFRAVDLSGAYPERVTDHIHFEVYKGRQKLNPINLKYSFDT